MNPSGAKTVDMTICFCDRLAELIISSAHLPQALWRTPATWCGPPGCAKGPGTHHNQPEARGPAHRTHRSERGSRVDLFLVAALVLVDVLLLLLMRAAGRRRAGGGQAGGPAGRQAGGRGRWRARSSARRATTARTAAAAAAARAAAAAAAAAARSEQQPGDARRARSSYKFKSLTTRRPRN